MYIGCTLLTTISWQLLWGNLDTFFPHSFILHLTINTAYVRCYGRWCTSTHTISGDSRCHIGLFVSGGHLHLPQSPGERKGDSTCWQVDGI